MAPSMIQALVGRDWRDTWNFAPIYSMHENDLFPPAFFPGHLTRPQRHINCRKQCLELSEVVNSKDKFQAVVDVSHFNPEDITVKTVDNCVVIDGKHEEKMDQHGFISRQFSRRYVLPEDVNTEDVVSSLTSDGLLTIEAPKKMEQLPSNERMVPITMKEASSPLTKEQMDAK